MECPICFKIIQDSVVTNCVHHFCKKCLNQWGHKKDNCPKCRSFIYSIKNDEEFNSINKESYKLLDIENLENLDSSSLYDPIFSKSESKTDEDINFYNLSISQLPFKKIGLSLSGNSYNSVKISKVEPKGIASFVGLKKGDIILSINNIPSISHKQSIKIIEFNKHINYDITLEVLSIDNSALRRFCGPLKNLF